MGALMELIGAVRTLRAEYSVPERSPVDIVLSGAGPELREALAVEARAVQRLGRVGSIGADGHAGDRQRGAHAVLRSGADLFVPLAGIIDIDRERQRLAKELERIEGLLRAAEARLASEQFAARAPADIVARERDKADSLRVQRDRLAAKVQGLR
jgi:valyl-tRNA synthetase